MCLSPVYISYTNISEMAVCVLITKDAELSPSTVLKINSPGYPDISYKSDTVLSWNVTAPATTEKILIVIDMNIIKASGGNCEDYLKVIFPKKRR